MKKIILVVSLILTMLLTGCNVYRIQETDPNYVEFTVDWPFDFGTYINEEKPILVFNGYGVDAIQDTRYFGYWYIGNQDLTSIELKEDNTVSMSDVQNFGRWYWAAPNVMLIVTQDNVYFLKIDFFDETTAIINLADMYGMNIAFAATKVE